MNVKCPRCRHDFEVTLTAVDSKPDLQTQYRQSVDYLQRHPEPIRIAPSKPDPDRPVSR